MFDSREDALYHRDSVVEVLQATFDEEAWHTHPVLDGAVVRIETANQDRATSAFEEAGFSVNDMGESGDWLELKVKP